VLDELMLYIDLGMPESHKVRMEQHLAVCPSCRNYLASYLQTIALTRSSLQPSDAGQPLAPALIDAVQARLRFNT